LETQGNCLVTTEISEFENEVTGQIHGLVAYA
jgi:hypothetical protein